MLRKHAIPSIPYNHSFLRNNPCSQLSPITCFREGGTGVKPYYAFHPRIERFFLLIVMLICFLFLAPSRKPPTLRSQSKTRSDSFPLAVRDP